MMNHVVLTGRLTKDPELKMSENNKAYVNITLAVPRSYQNENGEYDTDFINMTIWGNQAEAMPKYCKKGDLIAIKGRLETSRDNNDNYHLNVVTERLSFLSSKNINREGDVER